MICFKKRVLSRWSNWVKEEVYVVLGVGGQVGRVRGPRGSRGTSLGQWGTLGSRKAF